MKLLMKFLSIGDQWFRLEDPKENERKIKKEKRKKDLDWEWMEINGLKE